MEGVSFIGPVHDSGGLFISPEEWEELDKCDEEINNS